MRLIEEASPEDRRFLAEYLGRLGQASGPVPVSPEDDRFYRLDQLAVDSLDPLTNEQMDAIIYGLH